MTEKIRYLVERDSGLYFRRRVPEGLRQSAGCSEWKLALGKAGANLSQKMLEVRVLTEATDTAIYRLRRGQPISSTLLKDALLSLYPERDRVAQMKVSEASKSYLECRGESALSKPEAMAVSQFIQQYGDKPLSKVSRGDVLAWIRWLRSSRSQSEATIARRLASMSAITNSIIDELDVAMANPFARQRLLDAPSGYRLPFNQEQFELIEAWISSKSKEMTSALIIRLLRATGARPLEVGGLDVSDLCLDEDIPFLLVRSNRWRRLKTRNSQRAIPLVGDGLAAAQIALSQATGEALFPLTPHDTGSLSARLNKALRASGIPRNRRLTAYSFRHSMAEALRSAEVPFDVQKAILGHAKATVTEQYGSRTTALERLRQGMVNAHAKLFTVRKYRENSI